MYQYICAKDCKFLVHLSFIKFRDILFKNYDFRALDVNKTSILASNSLFYILKASFMRMHFSD